MTELVSLVRRDHDELHYALRVISEPLSDEAHVVAMLDRVRAMFPAHVEAEAATFDRMLDRSHSTPLLYLLVAQTIAAHLAQESALQQLLDLRPMTPAFHERARYLRNMMVHHAEHEAGSLHPAVPQSLAHQLAADYANERERVLEAHEAPMREVG